MSARANFTGVCWSGIESYPVPDPSWTVSAETQAAADAAYRKAKARMDAEVAEYARKHGLVRKDAA